MSNDERVSQVTLGKEEGLKGKYFISTEGRREGL